jgi:hypothetical protein
MGKLRDLFVVVLHALFKLSDLVDDVDMSNGTERRNDVQHL